MIRRVSFLTLLGLVTGGVVGLLAVGFLEAVLWMNDRLLISLAGRQAITDHAWLVAMTLGVPTVGGLIVGSLRAFTPGDRFHGPQEAIRTAQSLDPTMPARSGIVSTIAACLSLGAGASVGQYGPLVHMGASAGSWLRRVLNTDRSDGKIGIACGVAAAISAAFHAPIAGLVFAREVILRHYSLRAFAPIAVASTMAYVVAQVIFNREALFRIEGHEVASAYEYLVFVAIGIAGALLATAYMRAIEIAGALAARLKWPAPVKTALAGLALGIVALQVPEVFGMGQEVLRLAMAGGAFGAADLAQILVLKLLLTAICLAFGFAGGVFSPALLIGALFGALVGSGAEWFIGDQQSQIAVYAVCGLVAVTGPVIGAPLTMVLIVFELTQNFDLATASMVSVAFANLIGYRIFGRSLFDVQLKAQGFDLSLGRDKVTAEQYTIGDLLGEDVVAQRADDSLHEIRNTLVVDKRAEAHIVDASGDYVGKLTLHRLMELAATETDMDQPAGAFAEPASVTLGPDTSIRTAMLDMEKFVGESVPVLHDGRFVGSLPESAIVGAYLQILENIRREEHAAV